MSSAGSFAQASARRASLLPSSAMKNLIPNTANDAISVASAVTALGFPPATYAAVPPAWSSGGAVPEFEIEVWSDVAVNVTNAELLAGNLHPVVIADQTITALNAGADTLHIVGHSFLTGDGPTTEISTGAFIGGTDGATPYWIISAGADDIKLATSLANALAGVAVDITGVMPVGPVVKIHAAAAQRVHWHSFGLLGPLADGAIALTAQRAWLGRFSHRSRAVAYAIAGNLSAAVAVNVAIFPIQEVA